MPQDRGPRLTPAERAALNALVAELVGREDNDLAVVEQAARLVMARLLQREDEPAKLADGLAKVAGIILKAYAAAQGTEAPELEGLAARLLREAGLGPQGEQ